MWRFLNKNIHSDFLNYLKQDAETFFKETISPNLLRNFHTITRLFPIMKDNKTQGETSAARNSTRRRSEKIFFDCWNTVCAVSSSPASDWYSWETSKFSFIVRTLSKSILKVHLFYFPPVFLVYQTLSLVSIPKTSPEKVQFNSSENETSVSKIWQFNFGPRLRKMATVCNFNWVEMFPQKIPFSNSKPLIFVHKRRLEEIFHLPIKERLDN